MKLFKKIKRAAETITGCRQERISTLKTVRRNKQIIRQTWRDQKSVEQSLASLREEPCEDEAIHTALVKMHLREIEKVTERRNPLLYANSMLLRGKTPRMCC